MKVVYRDDIENLDIKDFNSYCKHFAFEKPFKAYPKIGYTMWFDQDNKKVFIEASTWFGFMLHHLYSLKDRLKGVK
jgi:hypothetical protein